MSSANFTRWLELWVGVQSCVSRVKRRGLSTQPCGAPVLRVMLLEMLLPTRTAWGLWLRKSSSQLQREVLRPSLSSLQISCCGIMVLNAELKSMNSILTYESFLSRWVSAGWRAEQIASSVDRFALYANWYGSRLGGRVDFMCDRTSRSKHFMIMGVSATGRLALKQDGDDFFGTGMMVAALKPDGTMACLREVLKMSVKTSFSSSAQSFSTLPGMLSGPAAFRVLMAESVLLSLVVRLLLSFFCRFFVPLK